MNRTFTILAIVLMIGAAAVVQVSTAQTRPVGEFMRAKLKHSQKILEGLTVENFESIAAGAHEISLLSQAANWQVIETEDYVQQSNEFRRSADALEAAAKKRNLDGAALAYVDMTMKCIKCHKYVRGIRMASGESQRWAEQLAQRSGSVHLGN